MNSLKPISTVIVLLIVSLISINLVSQFYFSSLRVNSYVAKTLGDQTDLRINFRKAQLSFSGSLSPFFAIKISEAKINYSNCNSDYEFQAPYVLIPFSITAAAKKKVRFGYLKASEGLLTVRRSVQICPDRVVESAAKLELLEILKFESLTFDVFFKKVQSAFKSINGLRFQKLEILDLRNSQKDKRVVFHNLRLSDKKRSRSIHSYFEIDFQPNDFNIPGTASEKNIRMKVKADLTLKNGLSFLVTARHLEGLVELQSKPQKEIHDYKFKAQVKDLPLSFLNYFSGTEVIDSINAHKVWLNSSLDLRIKNGFDSKQRVILAEFANVDIYGPVLKLFTTNFEAQLYPSYEIMRSIEWRLDYLNLNGLLNPEYLKKVRGVVDQFGEVRGSGQIASSGAVNFEGVLKGSSFQFSMNRKKAKQILSSANIIINYDHPNLKLNMDSLMPESGIFEGSVVGKISWKNPVEWSFGIEATAFKLADDVIDLFAIKQAPFTEFTLTSKGQARELQSLSAKANLAQLKTKWGYYKNSKYNVSYHPEKKMYQFNLSAESFKPRIKDLKIDTFDRYKTLEKFTTDLYLSAEDKAFEVLARSNAFSLVELRAEGEDYNKDFMAFLTLDKTKFALEGHINSGFRVKSVE